MQIEAVATVYYTCSLSDEDEKKVLDYIKENPDEFEFLTDKNKIVKAVNELYEQCEIALYEDSVESDFFTDEIRWSEFEGRMAEEILNARNIE